MRITAARVTRFASGFRPARCDAGPVPPAPIAPRSRGSAWAPAPYICS